MFHRRVVGQPRERGRMRTERHTLHDLPPETEDEFVDEPSAPARFAVTRGVAFFVGSVSLLVLLSEMKFPHFRRNTWWLDLRPLPRPLAHGFLALTAVLLLFFSFFPRAAPALRRLGRLCTAGLLGLSFWNIWRFYQHAGGVPAGTEVPVPFSLHVAGCLIVIVPGLLAAGWEQSNFFKDFLVGVSTIATCLAAFPLAQFVCLGKTADRGPADAVVVFADGAESATRPHALAERVGAACPALPRGKSPQSDAGRSRRVGRGDARDNAAAGGRRKNSGGDVLVGSASAEMEASVAAMAKVAGDQKLVRLVIAAPFYELPRIKLCCERAGLNATASPCARRSACPHCARSWFASRPRFGSRTSSHSCDGADSTIARDVQRENAPTAAPFRGFLCALGCASMLVGRRNTSRRSMPCGRKMNTTSAGPRIGRSRDRAFD